jgi:crotonobetainyl-CoA:carnitine CoA-transferase CaiB-like acyl-CoA transferase
MTTVAPLDGITVVECASYISGPYAGLILAQFGARVVKVEAPGSGDSFRRWGGTAKKRRVRPQFASLNYGKESVTLDLRAPEDQARLFDLVASADAFIENFRPGTLDAFGVGETVLRALNPALVYVTITGFGQSGPSADRPAYDAIVQALSGLWSQLTPESDRRPVGPPFSDMVSGLHGAVAVLAGLAGRSVGGIDRPQRFDVSMLGASLGLLGATIANHVESGEVEGLHARGQRSHSMAFVARDGLPLVVHLSSPEKFWIRLTEVLDVPSLRDDVRFASYPARLENFDELLRSLQEVFRTGPRHLWLERLMTADVPAAPLATIDQVIHDPHVVDAGMLMTVEGPTGEQFTVPRGAIRFEGDDRSYRRSVPAVGGGPGPA